VTEQSKLIEDLSKPLETIRKDLVSLVETMTKLRRVVKYPRREDILPDASHSEGMPVESVMNEMAELEMARQDFEEHVSNLLASLHECRAHTALAGKSLAKIIELSQPNIPKEKLS